MGNLIKQFTERRLRQKFIEEYLRKELVGAEFGGLEIRHTSMGDRVVIRAGRVGLAIGRRGRNIKKVTEDLRNLFGLSDVQVEVEDLENPELNPHVMAERVAISLQKGRHFRRTAHGTVRRVIAAGAKGCEIRIAGNVGSERARRETFRQGYVAKCGHPSEIFVKEGFTVVQARRGVMGITIKIMEPDAKLPDDIEIIAEPTAKSKEVLSPQDEAELQSRLEESEEEAAVASEDLETLTEPAEADEKPEEETASVAESEEESTEEAVEALELLEEESEENNEEALELPEEETNEEKEGE